MKEVFKVKQKDGTIKEYRILFSYVSKNTKKNYVIYTDGEYENNRLNVYAGVYDKDKKIVDIEKDEEWDEVESVLNELEEVEYE